MASQDEQAKLDAALDAALDELDSSDEDEDGDEENERFDPSPQIPSKPAVSSAPSSKLLSAPPVQMGPPRPPASTTTSVLPDDDRSAEKLFAIMMQQLVEGEGGSGGGGERLSGEEEDEFMERLMQEMQTQLAQMEAPTTSATKPKKQMSPATSKAKASSAKRRVGDTTSSPSTTGKDEVEAAISSLVEGLAKQVTMDDDEMEEVGQAPESDNDMLNRLMEGLAEGMAGGEGGDFNPDAVIDGMMEQLLSKDLMYDPMKQVATKFPGWLNEHRSTLSAEEYAEYVGGAFPMCSLQTFLCF